MSGEARRLLTTAEAHWLDTVKLHAPAQPFHGQGPTPEWSRRVAHGLTDPDATVSVVYTFDTGAHASGWWRNSEYERCWHLSLAGQNLERGELETLTPAEVRAWASVVFGEEVRRLWEEPPARHGDPYRPQGTHVVHLRLFVDARLQPITPVGEVYTLRPFDDGSSPEKIYR